MKRKILYRETPHNFYLCSVSKQRSLKDDLSCIVQCLYKNLNIEIYKDTDILLIMYRRSENV